jgi:hypothetical protein
VEDETRHGILLVCDISGYTTFVRHHARSASHARQITVRLLNAVVGAARPPLAVAELEGDAVFFAAIGAEEELTDLAQQMKEQIPRLFRAFKAEVSVLSAARDCTCAACACISDLRLKQVVHAGEVAVEKIGLHRKLFGLAVIVVHRMLKNPVPAREYLLLSQAAFSRFGDFFGLEPHPIWVELEGVGTHQMLVFHADQLCRLQEAIDAKEGMIAEPRYLDVLRWRLRRSVRTVLDRHGPAPTQPGKLKSA